MAQMARDLRAKGTEVISLAIGEPDFDDDSTIQSSDLLYDSLLKHDFDRKRAAEYASKWHN